MDSPRRGVQAIQFLSRKRIQRVPHYHEPSEFLARRRSTTAQRLRETVTESVDFQFLLLIILRSGDISTNPGPMHTCSACDQPASNLIRCTACHQWLHPQCSGIQARAPTTRFAVTFICPKCACQQRYIDLYDPSSEREPTADKLCSNCNERVVDPVRCISCQRHLHPVCAGLDPAAPTTRFAIASRCSDCSSRRRLARETPLHPQRAQQRPCADCGGVGSPDPVRCSSCRRWLHPQCAGLPSGTPTSRYAVTFTCRHCQERTASGVSLPAISRARLGTCAACNGVAPALLDLVRCFGCRRLLHPRCAGLPPGTATSRYAVTFFCKQCSKPRRKRNERRRRKLQRWRLRKPNAKPGSSLSILQTNIDCLTDVKLAELNTMILKDKPDVILLQETKLARGVDRPIAGYACYHIQRPGENIGGGVAIYTRSAFKWKKLVNPKPIALTDETTEWCAIEIDSTTGPLRIYNIYRHPIRPGPDDFNASCLPSSHRTFVGADMNAHHDCWDSFCPANAAGNSIYDALSSSTLATINDRRKHTHFSRATGAKSSPDVTLVSADLDTSVKWSTAPSIGSSDHLCLTTVLDIVPSVIPCTRTPKPLFKQANWPLYRDTVLQSLTRCSDGPNLATLCTAILAASQRAIPVSQGTRLRNPVPWFNGDCRTAVAERNRLQNLQHTSRDAKAAYVTACHRASEVIAEAKRNHNDRVVSSYNVRTRPGQIFGHMRAMDGRATRSTPQPIYLANGNAVSGSAKANAYAKTYRSYSNLAQQLAKRRRQIARKNHNALKTALNASPPPPDFTTAEVSFAISKLKPNKASGDRKSVV